MKMIRILLISAFIGLILTACGQQNSARTIPVDVEIAVRVEPEPLAVGESTLIVTLTGADGSRIDGARLQVHGNMDHAGMMAVDREVSDSTNGEYRIPFEWSMGGGWVVTVTAQLPNNGGEVSNSFDFFVEAVSSESIINQSSGMEMTAEPTSERSARTDSAQVNITYETEHTPTFTSEANATVTLTNADGNPITDATLEVVGDMAHAGMMSISGKGTHTENGRYTVPLRWTMAGDWQMTVKATLADGRHVEQIFDQSVTMP